MRKLTSLLMLCLIVLTSCSDNEKEPIIDTKDYTSDYGQLYDLRSMFQIGKISYSDLKNIAYYYNEIKHNDDAYFANYIANKDIEAINDTLLENI